MNAIRRRALDRRRGFTLVELMIVIVILGILSVLAVRAYRYYVTKGRNAEAVQFLGGVRSAQEGYYQAFGQYCGVGGWSLWPERALPYTSKQDWGAPPPGNPWRDLGVKSPGQVWFRYRMQSGTAAEAPPGDSFPADAQGRPWFRAQANGDHNSNNVWSTFEVTSFKPEVWINREDE